jgi:hypothetical protein
MNKIESVRAGTQNAWTAAIAKGEFEDEDAAVVLGQRELANGQLARMRRAADLSFMAVNRNLDFNDRRLRKSHNGQVAPRAQFVRGQRAPAQAGLFHTGDGPVELSGTTQNSHRSSSQAPVATITQRPIQPKSNEKSVGAASSPSPASRPSLGALPTAQLPGVRIQNTGPQSVKLSLQLPEGASVHFQAKVTFASPSFINRTQEYPGTIYLVNGPSTADDQIILHIDDDGVEDVKRRTKEYADYLSESDRLILQFKDDTGIMTWFVIMFGQRHVMVSFLDALRHFINRLNQPSSIQEVSATAATRPMSTEPQETATPTVQNPQQQNTTSTISTALLEDIVSWALHIVAFIRDAGPAELANADALPGIIRGASAAVLMEKHADFPGLDSKQRVAFVDDVCLPRVFEIFKHRMRPTEAVPTVTPTTKSSPDTQKIASTHHHRPTYSIEKLIELESTAVDPPKWLTELRYLPEMNGETRAMVRDVIQKAHSLLRNSPTVQTARIEKRATPQTIHPSPQKAVCGLDGNASPVRGREAGIRSDAVGGQLAPSITVTTPSGILNPEEPLVTIHGEVNGLNSSRHNKSGIDILGQSAGQFTGALSRSKSHLEDLMLLDGGEDFELIRAHDPEVAQIADRFARIHFDDEGPI